MVRELRRWFIGLIAIMAGWAALVGMFWLATDIPPEEPPEAFGVGPMYLLPVVFVLLISSGTWAVAALIRVVVLLTRRMTRSRSKAAA